MSAIFDFIATIGDALIAYIEFAVKNLMDLIWFVGFLAEMLPAMPAFFTWLPHGFVTILAVAFSVVVILRILGRSD